MESRGFYQMACSAAVAGSVTEMLTFPFDTAKVYLQLVEVRNRGECSSVNLKNFHGLSGVKRSPSFFFVLNQLRKENGMRCWFKGLPAGIHRQILYAGSRLSMYPFIRDSLRQWVGSSHDLLADAALPIVAGVVSGALSIIIASPADLIKIRLQAHSLCKEGHEGSLLYNSYTNRHIGKPYFSCGILSAYQRVIVDEGFLALWRGLTLNVVRNSLVCSAELVGYDYLKSYFPGTSNHPHVSHAVCGLSAGCLAAIVGTPVDVIKTRIMNSKVNNSKDFFFYVGRLLKKDGPSGFYKGFVPNLFRLGFFNMSLFFFYEMTLRHIQNFGRN